MTPSNLPSLDDLDPGSVGAETVFVRVDFNVPLTDGAVTDTARLEAALPTIRELSAAGAKVVLASHCGRPKGKPDPAYSLRPVATALAELLGRDVRFATDCVGDAARSVVDSLGPGDICLLENLRYHAAETANDEDFAAQLAALADAYVDEAFGTVHRAHASVVGVPMLLPRRAAGRLLIRESQALASLLAEPRAPFVAILGGAKISGKMDTIQNLLGRIDLLAVGGGMANTFLAAQGHDMAASLVENDRLEMAWDLLDEAATNEVAILLPEDLVTTDSLAAPGRIDSVLVGEVEPGMMAVDIGVRSRQRLATAVAEAGTIFWNGPMGVFETPPFDEGTIAVAEAVAASDAFSVIGGGETVAAVRRVGVEDRMSHVSTGGGAALELLAGKTLPGIEILRPGIEIREVTP